MNHLALQLSDEELDLLRFVVDWTIDKWEDEREQTLRGVADDPDHTSLEELQMASANVVATTRMLRGIRAQMNPRPKEVMIA